jgi:uncharacterized protein (TIGR00297 family)
MHISLSVFIVAVLLIAGMIFSIGSRKLTIPAALMGALTGWIIFRGAGMTGFLLLTAFFLLGTVATSWKRREKSLISGEEPGGERRNAGQVLANAGVAAILAFAAFIYPGHATLLQLMIAGSFASATADTLSSELGILYGRRFYNCLSWKKDNNGLDGVISLEGTLIGIAGAMVIALMYGAGFGWSINCLVIVLAGAIGNFSDSVLGAALERKNYLTNDWVNFLSTGIAALVVWVMSLILS